MRPLSTVHIVIAALLALVFVGCGNEAGPDDPDVFISNSWEDDDDPDHWFQFNGGEGEGTSSGVFDGEENRSLTEIGTLTGSWSHGEIQFTVDRGGQTTTYKAMIAEDRPDRFTFRAGTEELVLARQSSE